MKSSRTAQAFFTILGCCFLAVSLLTGCGWSAEGKGFRINSEPEDDSLEEDNRFSGE